MRNERAATAGLKTTSYAENVIAITHARSNGAEEALLANTRGEPVRGHGVQRLRRHRRRPAHPRSTAVASRASPASLAIEWCREAGLEVVEEALPFDVLQSADEVIISNSSRDMQGVHLVDDRQATPAPGPVTAKVVDIWRTAEADLGIDP